MTANKENFHGVYLLFCKNPKYFGRTYIGYTVNPNRRINQHNKGTQAGGARKTSNRGPWLMVLIIYGFPNDIAALRFEWAWQHPTISRRLNKVSRKKQREKVFDYCLRVLSEMLQVGPWNRLPLIIHWLDNTFKQKFPLERLPPIHMPINENITKDMFLKTSKNSPIKLSHKSVDISNNHTCCLCNGIISKDMMTCINSSCIMRSHVICLSKLFLNTGDYIPIAGKCPNCDEDLLWGDLVKKLNGCYRKETISFETIQFNEDSGDQEL